MASSVYSAYSQSAGEINNNLASFREDIDDIKGVNRQITQKNKQLLQDAYTKTDLDALRGLGEEVGIRTFKKYGGKALDYMDKRFLGGNISKDTEGFKNMLKNKLSNFKSQAEDGVDDLVGRGKNAFRQAEDGVDDLNSRLSGNSATEASNGGEVEMSETGGGNGATEGGEAVEEDGSPTSDALDDVDRVDETDIGDMSFDDFMNQFQVPRTSTGDIDFDRANETTNMSMEDARGQQLRSRDANEANEETGNEEGQKEDAPEEETKEDDAPEEETGGEESGNYGAEEPTEPSSPLEGGDDAGDALADAGEGAGEGAVDEGVGAGLEGVGAGLDATGVGAIVGVPLQIAGAVLEGGALYEAGKGIVDWVEQLFGKKPDAPSTKTLALPKAPPSIAQRGMLLTPTMDTLDTQPSFSGGW